MKKPFDPFDDRLRDKQKRRKHAEVESAKKRWDATIEENFKKALEQLRFPMFTSGDQLYAVMFSIGISVQFSYVRMNAKRMLSKFGYEVYKNENSKDGRWRINGRSMTVYANFTIMTKCGKTDIERSLLEHEL